MFTSNTDMWETPQDFFNRINEEFHFTIDACAIPANAKCARFYSPEEDGLAQVWDGMVWMNPPYGREIGEWVKKACLEALKGSVVVCLVPARTDTAWWHNWCMLGEIRFIRGRLKFGNSKNSAPFPSALVIFSREEIFHKLGMGPL
jgi:phage N-6-adenine-methyltransferase